jgi:hypothetical protein
VCPTKGELWIGHDWKSEKAYKIPSKGSADFPEKNLTANQEHPGVRTLNKRFGSFAFSPLKSKRIGQRTF